MRTTIVAPGSLGDVRPYVALGAGLREAGHHVRLATHACYEDLVQEQGLDFFPLGGDPDEILASPAGQQWQASGRNVLRFISGFARVIEPLMRAVLIGCRDACDGADLAITSLLGFCATYHVAEKTGVPLLPAFYLPLTPTRNFPSFMLTGNINLGASYNWCTHALAGALLWEPLRPAFNRLRREVLDLPPLPFGRVQREFIAGRWHVLYGYSSMLVPAALDWSDRMHVTGYWFLERSAQWTPPPAVVDFLAAGPPPVYVGFGSMHLANAAEMTALVVKALAATRQRGVLLTNAGAFCKENLPDSVLAVQSIPHDWLFPRTAAVVHHGGAGTTATALRAGVPSVGVPFFADQPFWTRRLTNCGAAPPPIHYRGLTAERLADAIRLATTDPAIKRRAAALGVRARAENGVARAVDVIQAIKSQ